MSCIHLRAISAVNLPRVLSRLGLAASEDLFWPSGSLGERTDRLSRRGQQAVYMLRLRKETCGGCSKGQE